MIYTTIEQSKLLMEAGLSEDSADLVYCALIRDSRNNIIEKPEYKMCLKGTEAQNKKGFEVYDIIPAWSFSNLASLYFKIANYPEVKLSNLMENLINRLVPWIIERGN